MPDDQQHNRRAVDLGTIATAVALLSTLIGGGTAMIFFLADIRAEQRVINSDVVALRSAVNRIEAHLDRKGP